MIQHDDTQQHPPWWLESGTEICQFCQRTFHYEAGFHCVYCDRPICPLCVVTVLEARGIREVHCPECHQGDDSGREGDQ